MKPLPHRFPSEVDVIRRDVERLRHLSPAERWEALLAFLEEGHRLAAEFPMRGAVLEAQTAEREEQRRLLRELLKKHVR